MQDFMDSIEFSQEFIDAVVQEARSKVDGMRQHGAGEAQACINQKAALEGRRNKLEDALLDGTIERDVFKRKHADIQAQVNLVLARMQEVEQRNKIDLDIIEQVLAFCRDVGQSYNDGDFGIKRHYLRFFFDKVMIKNKLIEEVVYTPIIAALQDLRLVIIKQGMLPRLDSNQQPSD